MDAPAAVRHPEPATARSRRAAPELPSGPPVLLAVDGNSLLHRSFHAGGPVDPGGPPPLDDHGRPIWAIRGVVTWVARAAARLRPDAVVVGFDCPDSSQRKDDYAGYKAHRPAKADDLVEQLRRAPGVLAAAGLPVLTVPGCEADDVLASCAAAARSAGWRSVAMTSDRDAFALIDDGTSVLRIRNGGLDGSPLVTPAGLLRLYGVPAGKYRDFAAIRGDSSDNLPGVAGIGAKTAARLVADVGSVQQLFALLDRGGADRIDEIAGPGVSGLLSAPGMRANVLRNHRLMAMRADLPVPRPDEIRLPIDLGRARVALGACGINLGPSLWALTGADPPEPEPEPAPFVPARRRRLSRVPGAGQLALF